MNTKAGEPKTRRYIQTARAEAAEATARRIAAAFLARLLTQWFDEITLDRVAADAGVTVQTVIRRFGGKEGLLSEAVKILAEQIHSKRSIPAGDLRLMAERLVEDYEQTGDAIVRLLALEPRHPALAEFLEIGRRYHRNWVAGLLESRLAPLDSAARKRATDALVIATDVYTWKLLRRDMGRSAPAVTATIERLIHAAIGEFAKPQS
jgi:AcrR family transcriptional regulator